MSLYNISKETSTIITKFKISSARKDTPQALIVSISKNDQTVTVENPDSPIGSIDELKDELPETSPRFIILSYPYTLSDGRKAYPYVMLYFRPPSSSQTLLMSYAGAVELLRNKSNVSKVIEFTGEDDLDDIEDLIK